MMLSQTLANANDGIKRQFSILDLLCPWRSAERDTPLHPGWELPPGTPRPTLEPDTLRQLLLPNV
jgi:hypothetical protein